MRFGPLPPVTRTPLCVSVRLSPTVALTCGRPAALAIATFASVASSVSRCAGERRIGLIGRDERLAQRVGAGRAGHQGSNQRSGNEAYEACECPLESECCRAAEARQRRNARIADGQSAERAAGLAADHQAGDSAIDDRRAKAAAVGQLVDDRVGNDTRPRRRSGSGHRERRLASPASSGPSTTSTPCSRAAAASSESLSSAMTSSPIADKHRSRIAGAGADHERALARLRLHLGQ